MDIEESFMGLTEAKRAVAYIGIPGEVVYRFASQVDPPFGVPLDPGFHIAELGDIGAGRRNIHADRAQLAIAILADYLGDRSRVARLYSAFSERTRSMFPAGRVWMVTEIEVAELVRATEFEGNLTWDDEKGRYQDEPDEDLAVQKAVRKTKKEEAASPAATQKL